MAEKKKTQQRKPAPKKKASSRPIKGGKEMSLTELFKKQRARRAAEFKPDAKVSTLGKTLRMTQLQRLRLTKWVLYVLTVVLSLVVQDVVMSQVSIFGATTDLAVCAILLITVLEGTEVGSIFVLIASTLYFFSGSAPGAYCIALMTFLGIGATLFRQMYWHRSRGSILLCAAIAVTGYELGLFVIGLMNELTLFSRIGIFGLTALLSCLALIPLYSLVYKIGLIGGNTWKE